MDNDQLMINKERREKKDWGLIQIYTGEGKGKSTAALGLAVRAAGQGKKAAIIYFDKGGNDYGERNILDGFHSKIDYFATGLDRRDKETGKFRLGVTEDDKKEAARGFELANRMIQNYDLLILDEINFTLSLGMLPINDFLEFLNNKPDSLEIVLTGRNCPQEILDKADLVTEMTLVKHYFYKGVEPRRGIEY